MIRHQTKRAIHMNAKFLMCCAAVGLGGLAASTEVEARVSTLGSGAEARPAAVASVASGHPNLRPELLIAPGKLGSSSLIEHELVPGTKVVAATARKSNGQSNPS